MASYYVTAEQPTDLNRNTEWFTYPGVWTTYILILFFSWLLVLSIFGCSPGMAWTIVNLSHFAAVGFMLFILYRKSKTVYHFSRYVFRQKNAYDSFDPMVDKEFCKYNVTYHFFHWKKGTPFPDDQGIYNSLTWWEQIDHGKQLTRNRKFLTVVPVVLTMLVGTIKSPSSVNSSYIGVLDQSTLVSNALSLSVNGHIISSLESRYLIASHTTDYQNPMLFFNTLAVMVLVIAKFPHMHKVRIFGINGDL
ncbi:hypothetical protein RHMOL_Rhmol01G0230600 [Rhododendron molle]|uniref:Uncharacterized protein n=1 Tax=Rhododendron molle TaxID=49168 RepID=A0ACC0Q7X3_RHOML|nr:hypothetical protein RHMOL_Rhmol01G0230600 [Rhododendron molle]